MTLTNWLRRITTTLLSCGLTALSAQADDISSQSYELDIDALPLTAAVKTLSDETGIEVLFFSEIAEGVTSSPVQGEYTPTEALETMLNSTDLKVVDLKKEGAVAIAMTATDQRGASDSKNLNPQPVLMAQNQSTKVTPVVSSDAAIREDEKKRPLDEIVVTGTSIRGVAPESSPVDIYDKVDIQNLGATNAREFLAQLPQNLSAATSVGGTDITRQANRNQVNAPDLRGLGVGTTLVLLNGHRLPLSNSGSAVDTSLIPIAAIDRVEVLLDGASSLYGTDAVGGVVNFVMRDDFDGAMTTLTGAAVTDGGYRRGDFSQLLGKSWDSGSILGSVTVTRASELEAKDRDFAAAASPRYLSPDEQGHSVFLAAHQDIGERLRVFGDFLYSNRDVRTIIGQEGADDLDSRDEIEQYFVTVGANVGLTDDLIFDFTSSYAKSENFSDQTAFEPEDGIFGINTFDEPYESFEHVAKLDGPLFPIFGNEIKFSLGIGRFEEDFESVRNFRGNISGSGGILERSTDYVFGELQIPLVTADQSLQLASRIEINVSGRYTDTSDAGDSFDPKVGLVWVLNESLQFRGTYGTSFRAPRLLEIAPADISVLVIPVDAFGFTFPDPFTNDRSTVYFLRDQGSNPNLVPETATSYTAGFDFTPASVPGLSISGTYFDISYENRIGRPTRNVVGALSDPATFGAVVRSATLEEIAEALPQTSFLGDFSGNGLSLESTPEEILAVVTRVYDIGVANISTSETDGFDLAADYSAETAIGDLSIGGAMTYLLSNDQRLTASSPLDERLDTITNPVDLRFRAHIGLSNGTWNGRLNVNYVDSYENIPESGQTNISSWTTVDLLGSYAFPESQHRLLSGIEFRLSVRNLFDEDPPYIAEAFSGVSRPIGFDPANANPFGRLVTVQIDKRY